MKLTGALNIDLLHIYPRRGEGLLYWHVTVLWGEGFFVSFSDASLPTAAAGCVSRRRRPLLQLAAALRVAPAMAMHFFGLAFPKREPSKIGTLFIFASRRGPRKLARQARKEMGKRGGDLLEDQSYCPNHSETVSIANATTDANDQLIDKMAFFDTRTWHCSNGRITRRRQLFWSFFPTLFYVQYFCCTDFMKNDLIEAQKLRSLLAAACF